MDVGDRTQITTDGTGIYMHDQAIGEFGDHLHYRWSQFCEKRGAIDEYEGGLEKFSRGMSQQHTHCLVRRGFRHAQGQRTTVCVPALRN
jgi:hypothetical protein